MNPHRRQRGNRKNPNRTYIVRLIPVPRTDQLEIDVQAMGPFLAAGMAEAMNNTYRAVSVEHNGQRVEIVGRCQGCKAFVTGDDVLRDDRQGLWCGECRK